MSAMPHNPLDAGPEPETGSLDLYGYADIVSDAMVELHGTTQRKQQLAAIEKAEAALERAKSKLLPPDRNALAGMVI